MTRVIILWYGEGVTQMKRNESGRERMREVYVKRVAQRAIYQVGSIAHSKGPCLDMVSVGEDWRRQVLQSLVRSHAAKEGKPDGSNWVADPHQKIWSV